MRHLLTATLVASLALAAACGKKDEEKKNEPAPKTTEPVKKPEPPKQLTAADKIKTVEGCWAAADAGGDEAAFKNCYSADATFSFPDSVPPMSAKGGEGALGLLKPFQAAFPDLKHHLGMILVSGDHMATMGVVQGTNNGDFMGMPATKKPVAMWFAQVGNLKDGKAVRDDHYFDGGTLMAQLGVSPNPMAPAADKIEAPTEIETVEGDPEGATEKANLELAKKSEELMKAKDWKGMLDLYADDAVFHYVPSGETTEGKEAIGKSMNEWMSMHSALESTVRDEWAAGDWIVCETTNKGTMAKNLPGTKVKTKGKSYEAQYLEFIKVQDGKIAEHWIFGNTSKWAADLGLFDPSKMGGAPAKKK